MTCEAAPEVSGFIRVAVEAFGNTALGSCVLSAWFIGLGIALCIFVAVAVMLSSREGPGGMTVAVAAGFGTIPVVILGLWSPFTVVFIGLLVVFALKNHLGGD